MTIPENTPEQSRGHSPVPKYVTEQEMKLLYQGASKTKHPIRNKLILMMLYQHGLRETELCKIKLEHLDLEQGKFTVHRVKGSNGGVHPIPGDELRLIRRYLRYKVAKAGSDLPWLFVSSWGNPFCRSSIIKLVKACAIEGGITQKTITPHMLRHGCGYYLANKGYDIRVIQEYLGHKNIQNTVIYTQLTGKQFVGMWE